MSKVIALTQILFNPFAIFQGKSFSVFKTFSVSPKKLWLYVLAGLNIVLFFSYILGVNSNTSQGYEIKKLQTQISSFTEQNKKLNLKISEISSMVSIQNNLVTENFVSAGTPKFLEVRQFSLK